jgi:predicted  nucleic acid-binding Zn-ribbon protein
MMDLVRDIYNKLHTRDQLVFCPSCQRILYIPDELPPETAVHKPKERKERAGKAPPAATNRQTSAVDVLRSVTADEDEPEQTTESSADATQEATQEARQEATQEEPAPPSQS